MWPSEEVLKRLRVHDEAREQAITLLQRAALREDSPESAALMQAAHLHGAASVFDVLVRHGHWSRDENLELHRLRIPDEFPATLLASASSTSIWRCGPQPLLSHTQSTAAGFGLDLCAAGIDALTDYADLVMQRHLLGSLGVPGWTPLTVGALDRAILQTQASRDSAERVEAEPGQRLQLRIEKVSARRNVLRLADPKLQ